MTYYDNTGPAAGMPARIAPTAPLPALFGAVRDRLDVVAVWIADERAEVARVVLRPDLRLVEHFGAGFDGSSKERPDGRPVSGLEGDMRFPEPDAGLLLADPEIWAIGAIADSATYFSQPGPAQRSEDQVVEREARGEVRGLDREMIEHASNSSTSVKAARSAYAASATIQP